MDGWMDGCRWVWEAGAGVFIFVWVRRGWNKLSGMKWCGVVWWCWGGNLCVVVWKARYITRELLPL